MSILATRSGICPLCSKYIAKNLSPIVRLPKPIVPRGDGRISADDNRPYHADGHSIGLHPREWCHVACYPRHRKPPAHRQLYQYGRLTYQWEEPSPPPRVYQPEPVVQPDTERLALFASSSTW
jgi:hypothetical protein